MDEYDELFEIQDDFEEKFADELDAFAQLERGEGLACQLNFLSHVQPEVLFPNMGGFKVTWHGPNT